MKGMERLKINHSKNLNRIARPAVSLEMMYFPWLRKMIGLISTRARANLHVDSCCYTNVYAVVSMCIYSRLKGQFYVTVFDI